MNYSSSDLSFQHRGIWYLHRCRQSLLIPQNMSTLVQVFHHHFSNGFPPPPPPPPPSPPQHVMQKTCHVLLTCLCSFPESNASRNISDSTATVSVFSNGYCFFSTCKTIFHLFSFVVTPLKFLFPLHTEHWVDQTNKNTQFNYYILIKIIQLNKKKKQKPLETHFYRS